MILYGNSHGIVCEEVTEGVKLEVGFAFFWAKKMGFHAALGLGFSHY